MEEVLERKHPIYWFDDGSIILDVEVYQFKVHNTLVSRHSRFFSAKNISSETVRDLNKGPETASPGVNCIILDANAQIRANDVEALLRHLYHDVPLRTDSPFAHVASLLRVSAPQQLDYPALHESAKDILEGMFPTNPASFTHDHPLHDALPLVTQFKLRAARKAILYSLVTTTEFDISNSTTREDPQSLGQDITGVTADGEPAPQSDSSQNFGGTLALSPPDSQICTTLMTRLIDYFSPILFTAPAASHMKCTDIFADTWMTLVIQPAIENDGVYKPLETLQLIKGIDWEERGLCASCTAEKREEWTEEQKTIWKLVDDWIEISDATVGH